MPIKDGPGGLDIAVSSHGVYRTGSAYHWCMCTAMDALENFKYRTEAVSLDRKMTRTGHSTGFISASRQRFRHHCVAITHITWVLYVFVSTPSSYLGDQTNHVHAIIVA